MGLHRANLKHVLPHNAFDNIVHESNTMSPRLWPLCH